MTTFSVLICTYNRPEMLAMALTALIERTLEKPGQVVVVNGGDERSDEIVQKYAGRSDVQVGLVKTINNNLAASRNIGLTQCTGEIVAMTDDDAEVFPDWVTQMKKNHAEHPEAGAVGGMVIGTEANSLVSKVAELITFPVWPASRYVNTLPGVNISYKRRALEVTGIQDESLFRGEDVDFNWRIQEAGYKVFYCPEIKVYHHHRSRIRSLLNQRYMYGKAYFLVRKKWPAMYCIYPHHIQSIRHIVQAINVVAGLFYRPFIWVSNLSNPVDRLLALPLLFVTAFVWRWGMLVQAFQTRKMRSKTQD